MNSHSMWEFFFQETERCSERGMYDESETQYAAASRLSGVERGGIQYSSYRPDRVSGLCVCVGIITISREFGSGGRTIGKKTAENNENRTKISEKTAEIDEKSSENSKKTAKNAPKTAQNSTKKAPKPMEIAAQPSENEATDNNIHTKSNTNTSTIYKEKKKEKEKDVVVVATPPTTPTPSASPTAIRPWQQYVAELNSDSEWGQIVCMKSGYGALLKKHWKTAKELFRQHVIAMGKEQSLLTQDEAKRYFMSFAATCPTTAGELRQQLLRLEQAATATADPYRYEQRLDGRRTCNGRPIPDDAPPRPDDHSTWNSRLKRWEPEYG